jgi:phosphatidate cytidylyltransferase
MAPVVLLVIFALPHSAAVGLLTVLILAGAWEWSAFPRFESVAVRWVYAAGIAALLAGVWAFGAARSELDVLLYAAIAWWIVALLWIARAPSAVNRLTAALAGVLVLLPAWLALARLHGREPALLLFLLLLVVAADVGAYFAGRQFGRNKLAPRVSPGKTWEGVFGGLAAATLLALVGVWWFDMPAASFLLLCTLTVIASVVGDLTESLFKRHAGLKDSGALLPGHGGVLDRVDSITAAAPVFLLGLERLGLLR